MSKQLSVDEKSVYELLSSGKEKSFLIPYYQRAYEWTKDEIDLLFDDLTEFARASNDNDSNRQYFLGTIVSYPNDDGKREIIDGQQRIVSLMLLLRAIYDKLSSPKKVPSDVEERLKEIQTSLWRRIKKTSSEVDFSKTYIRSESIDDSYKDVLQSILTSGKPPRGRSCNYSRNYIRLKRKFNEFHAQEPSMAEAFVYCLLHETIVFSIEASTRDTALMIFSTLNNRGLPLSDTNIFRAELYKNTPAAEREAFKDAWSHFINRAEAVIKMDGEDFFSQYMYYLRAEADDSNSTAIGVRTYFTRNKSEHLRDSTEVMSKLEQLLNVWAVAKNHEVLVGIDEEWSRDVEILKIFDLLLPFPNHAWRAAAVVYYLYHREESDFATNFRAFMRKLFAWYVPLYILHPDRTFIREYILRLNIETKNNTRPRFESARAIDTDRLETALISSKSYQKLMLKAIAYSHHEQTEPLPTKYEIDRVFDDSDDRIGNLTLIEKKPLENSFARKKNAYGASSIAMTRALVNEPDEWTPDEIAARSRKLAESLIELWTRWSDEYDRRL